MYKILGTDQKEHGPASAGQVRQWISEGRATRQTQIRVEGIHEWKPLSGFDEFDAALAARTATAPAASPLTAGSTPPPVPTGPPATGLAVTSMVLGILSFIGCSIISGIPAIITGHIA